MHDYWLYAYNQEGGLIGPPIAIPAADDEVAIARALPRLSRLDADLRDGERLVRRISGSRPPAIDIGPLVRYLVEAERHLKSADRDYHRTGTGDRQTRKKPPDGEHRKGDAP